MSSKIKIKGDNNVAVSGTGNKVRGGARSITFKLSLVLSVSVALAFSAYFAYQYVAR